MILAKKRAALGRGPGYPDSPHSIFKEGLPLPELSPMDSKTVRDIKIIRNISVQSSFFTPKYVLVAKYCFRLLRI